MWTAVGRTGRISWRTTGTPSDGGLPGSFAAGQPAADDVNHVNSKLELELPKTHQLAVGDWSSDVCAKRLGRRQLLRPHVRALLVVADQLAAVLLGDLLDQERRLALRARLGDRPVPQREVAVRIVRAAEEHLAAPRLALDDVAAVLRAEHAGGLLLHVLAGRIVAARGELAEAALLDDQVRLALRALLVEDLVRLRRGHALLGRDDLPRRLALGIAGAGEELAEAAALDAIGLPQFSQASSISPSAPGSGVSSSRVFSHSG